MNYCTLYSSNNNKIVKLLFSLMQIQSQKMTYKKNRNEYYILFWWLGILGRDMHQINPTNNLEYRYS